MLTGSMGGAGTLVVWMSQWVAEIKADMVEG